MCGDIKSNSIASNVIRETVKVNELSTKILREEAAVTQRKL